MTSVEKSSTRWASFGVVGLEVQDFSFGCRVRGLGLLGLEMFAAWGLCRVRIQS